MESAHTDTIKRYYLSLGRGRRARPRLQRRAAPFTHKKKKRACALTTTPAPSSCPSWTPSPARPRASRCRARRPFAARARPRTTRRLFCFWVLRVVGADGGGVRWGAAVRRQPGDTRCQQQSVSAFLPIRPCSRKQMRHAFGRPILLPSPSILASTRSTAPLQPLQAMATLRTTCVCEKCCSVGCWACVESPCLDAATEHTCARQKSVCTHLNHDRCSLLGRKKQQPN
jgi:hypothetical protein